MAVAIDQEVDRFVEQFPAIAHAVRDASVGHPLYASLDQLLSVFGEGYLTYLYTGATPEQAYVSMRWLYCLSNGRFNDLMQEFIGSIHPPRSFPDGNGILGNLDSAAIEEIKAGLVKDGIWIFKNRAPLELCERLEAFASTVECQVPSVSDAARTRYDPQHPLSVLYRVPEVDLISEIDVQKILADPSLLAIAEAYLECEPVIADASMWWSTAMLDQPDGPSAQLFHFDMDQLCFFKFFIYLTDVTAQNGPHCVVRGSHHGKPLALRRDGRIPDSDFEPFYSPKDMLEITGPRGTMFVVDTRAFHKGKYLRAGDRLVFQTVYAVNLFGAAYDIFGASEPLDPLFSKGMAATPRTFAKFVWGEA